MQEMKRVQEVNRYTEGITDEERRKNAEQMMIKFAQAMGIGEDDYGDSD
jgi:hypothetical protein